MYKHLTLLIFSTLFFLYGCGGGGSSDSNNTIPATLYEAVNSTEKFFSVNYPKSCTQTESNRFVYEVMHDSYLFAAETPIIDYTTFEDTASLLDALRTSQDRYSFTADAQTTINQLQEGKNENFGFHLFAAASEEASHYYLIVSHVYPGSPADRVGIQRGDIIEKINDLWIYDIQEASVMLSNEDTLTFQIDNQAVELTKAEYDIHTVLYSNILSYENKKVGYLLFQTFISQAEEELNEHFAAFRRAGVEELVLDLRYNGGGLTSVANHLATLIGGSNLYGKVFESVQFNDKYSTYNTIEHFAAYHADALNLKRVFVITTGMTASSSELVINGLRASANNMEVIQIGSTTYGKPYGFYPTFFCDTALFAVNVESTNSDGTGDYTDGITPTCPADDNLFKAFGDTTEPSLQEALYYISQGRCSTIQTANKMATKPVFYPLPSHGVQNIIPGY